MALHPLSRVVAPFIFVIALADVAGFAQQSTLNYEVFSSAEGLPTASIRALARDARGYLWLGTNSGLIRFDGVQFTAWGRRGEPALPSERIEALLQARDGSLWVGFCGSGVSRISNGRVVTLTVSADLVCVRSLFQSADGAIWVGARSGVTRFRANKWERMPETSGLPMVSAFGFLEDREGRLWVATSAGVFRRAAAASDRFERISTAVVKGLAEDAQGGVWINDSTHGCQLIAPGQVALVAPCPEVEGVNVFHDRRGRLWVGSRSHGLFRSESREVVSTTGGHSRMVQEIREGSSSWAFLEDDEGSIWIGTAGRLFRFFESNLRVEMRIADSDSGRETHPPPLEIGTSDTMWVGTPNGLIAAAASGSFRPRTVFTGQRITALREDGGRLWIGTANGFGTLARGRFRPVPNTPTDTVYAVSTDGAGNPWVCFEADSVPYRLRGGALTPVDVGTDATRSCVGLAKDRRGRIWIGFANGTIGVHDGTHLRVFLNERFPLGAVASILEAGDGTVWAGSIAGLSRLEGDAFVPILNPGLPGGRAGALVEDASGHLWVGFGTGVARFAYSELTKARLDPSYRPQYRLYDAADGLERSATRLFRITAASGPDRRVWLMTPSMVVAVQPDRGVDVARPAKIAMRIDDLFVDGRHIDARDHVTLPPGTQRVQVDYSAATLALASKVRYRYKLDGFDRDWVDAGVQRQAFYTALPPGDYQFRVASILNGDAQLATEWSFTIRPRYYQTWWFYGLCATAVGLVVSSAWSLRLWIVKQEYAATLHERTRIARALHDTIVQNMTGMALRLEGVVLDAQEPMAKRLRDIRRQMEHEVGQARRSIQELRTGTLDMLSLHDALREFGERSVMETQTEFVMTVTGDAHRASLDVEEELLWIGQEAITNAVRHSGASRLCAELSYASDRLRLTISDNGCGFPYDPDDILSGHWGVRGMHERARRFSGVVRVTSGPGAGTVVDATIPIRSVPHHD